MRKENTTTVERQTYSAQELAVFLGLSRAGAYNLMHAADFPSFRIGGRLLVTRAALEKWIAEQQERQAV